MLSELMGVGFVFGAFASLTGGLFVERILGAFKGIITMSFADIRSLRTLCDTSKTVTHFVTGDLLRRYARAPEVRTMQAETIHAGAKRIAFVLGLPLLLAGCAPEASLNPLFTENDVVFDPALVGTWRGMDRKDESNAGKPVWAFGKSGENAYSLVVTADGKRTDYKAHLVKVGQYLFFDALPDPPDGAFGDYLYLVPTHVFGRIWMEGGTARIAFLDDEWTKKMVDENRLRIAHTRVEDAVVLTAATKDLQRFVLKYADNEQAFSTSVELRREE